MLNYSQVRQEVLNLVGAVEGSNSSLPNYTNAVTAVNSLNLEIPNLEMSFMEVQDNANVQDFSSTLDSVELVELAR